MQSLAASVYESTTYREAVFLAVLLQRFVNLVKEVPNIRCLPWFPRAASSRYVVAIKPHISHLSSCSLCMHQHCE